MEGNRGRDPTAFLNSVPLTFSSECLPDAKKSLLVSVSAVGKGHFAPPQVTDGFVEEVASGLSRVPHEEAEIGKGIPDKACVLREHGENTVRTRHV